jgi:hypothetical protein
MTLSIVSYFVDEFGSSESMLVRQWDVFVGMEALGAV